MAHLKEQVKRLARSRNWGEAALAQAGSMVTLPRAELEALRRDLQVCCHLIQCLTNSRAPLHRCTANVRQTTS